MVLVLQLGRLYLVEFLLQRRHDARAPTRRTDWRCKMVYFPQREVLLAFTDWRAMLCCEMEIFKFWWMVLSIAEVPTAVVWGQSQDYTQHTHSSRSPAMRQAQLTLLA